MAQADEIRFKEFRASFATEDVCRAELFRLRFSKGFEYPKCHCRRHISVTAGTVMHRTHLPLTVWFLVIWLVATDKRGISAVQLQNALGI